MIVELELVFGERIQPSTTVSLIQRKPNDRLRFRSEILCNRRTRFALNALFREFRDEKVASFGVAETVFQGLGSGREIVASPTLEDEAMAISRATVEICPRYFFILASIAFLASSCVYSWLATPPTGILGSAASKSSCVKARYGTSRS